MRLYGSLAAAPPHLPLLLPLITSALSLCSPFQPRPPSPPWCISCTDGGQQRPTRPQGCVTPLETGNDDLALNVSLSLSPSRSRTLLQLSLRFLITFVHSHRLPQPSSLYRSVSLSGLFSFFFRSPCPYCSSSLSRAVTTPPAEPPRLFIANRGWRCC